MRDISLSQTGFSPLAYCGGVEILIERDDPACFVNPEDDTRGNVQMNACRCGRDDAMFLHDERGANQSPNVFVMMVTYSRRKAFEPRFCFDEY